MAKILEEVVVVKVSKLVRADAKGDRLITENVVSNLEMVFGDIMADAGAIVEVLPLDQFIGDGASGD